MTAKQNVMRLERKGREETSDKSNYNDKDVTWIVNDIKEGWSVGKGKKKKNVDARWWKEMTGEVTLDSFLNMKNVSW